MSWSRTLRIRQELRAHIEAGEDVGLLFSDLRGFSSTAVERGDHVAFEISEEHFEVVRDQMRDVGIVVKALGDGVLSAFPDPAEAVYAAVAIQEALRTRNAAAATPPLHAGIGVTSGTPVMTDMDFIGHAVNVSQRLSAIAKGGQILTTESVQASAALPAGLRYLPLGDRELKGMGPVRVVEVAWLQETARVSDVRDHVTLILTERGTVLVERRKDPRAEAQDALRNVLDAGPIESGPTAWTQRAAARLALWALRRPKQAGAATWERPLSEVRVTRLRRGLRMEHAGGRVVLREADPIAAALFVQAVERATEERAPGAARL